MPDAGILIGLDLGVRTGWAEGVPGRKPKVSTYILKRDSEPIAVAFANLFALLRRRLKVGDVALVAKEAPFHLGAATARGGSEAAVRASYGFHAIVEGAAAMYGIRCVDGYDSTIRKHFIGVGRTGDRKTTKAAVVLRCVQLGFLPRGCTDEDSADAAAVFDWAGATVLRRPYHELELFPPTSGGKRGAKRQ